MTPAATMTDPLPVRDAAKVPGWRAILPALPLAGLASTSRTDIHGVGAVPGAMLNDVRLALRARGWARYYVWYNQNADPL